VQTTVAILFADKIYVYHCTIRDASWKDNDI